MQQHLLNQKTLVCCHNTEKMTKTHLIKRQMEKEYKLVGAVICFTGTHQIISALLR